MTDSIHHLHPEIRQGASPEQWADAAWQLRHSFTSAEQLERVLQLSQDERETLSHAGERLALRITPHFLSLIDPADPADPLRLQVVPRAGEMRVGAEELSDPCGEDQHAVAPGLIHRYPDRVLFLCTDRCATYCRYCTRSRLVSGAGEQKLRADRAAALEYLREHREVRDVLLSGGDPLLLSDAHLREILEQLRAIPHIQLLRIGTRVPIMLPQRITPELCAMLREFAPLFISIHCNHPRELCADAEAALIRLADSGIPLGNQSVLLRGVNNDAQVMTQLCHRLLQCRVRPYYLYQCDPVRGTAHLRARIQDGLQIIEAMRGFTSGYAIPQYVIDAPGGGGKVPINPDYIVRHEPNGLVIRNYQGKEFFYPENNCNNSK